MLDNLISVYKNVGDVFFYVNGPVDENELLFVTVLAGMQETLSILLRYGPSRTCIVLEV